MDIRKRLIALCSGHSFWHTKKDFVLGVPSVTVSDGPAGLRKQTDLSDMFGLNRSVPATCFPSESLAACSWDAEIAGAMGAAIAREAKLHGVGMVLGPGVNIKRNPLCGRNFEYFSEDPLLSGVMSAAYIRGMQDEGVASCPKHFACNSQEYKRFTSDSVVDERTMRELYLLPFEMAVRTARPKAIMCAYNRINGTYCSSNARLLTGILRDEWGFGGLVVSDWGGMADRTEAFRAGCDLAMPGGSAYGEKAALTAVRKGSLALSCVEKSAARVAEWAKDVRVRAEPPGNQDACGEGYAAALRAAEESFVLLKNEGSVLPLSSADDAVYLGAMVRNLRIQGAGSSHINPWKKTELSALIPGMRHASGCNDDGSTDDSLVAEAAALSAEAAAEGKVTVVVAGLPEAYESEGFDRQGMSLPDGVNRLVHEAARANPRTVVVLVSGSPVEIPWEDEVQGILYAGLPGEAGAEAMLRVLSGRSVPCGKLAETWPVAYADCPSAPYYGERTENGAAFYREGLYVGYRYYLSAGVETRYSFGHGLSYARFSYSGIQLEPGAVSCTVRNEGSVSAKEVVQLYVEPPLSAGIYRPRRELKGFGKISLGPGESRRVSFPLDDATWRVWHSGAWRVPGGEYRLLLGSSSTDIRLRATFHVKESAGGVPTEEERALSPWYFSPKGSPSAQDAATLLCPSSCGPAFGRPFTMHDTISSMKSSSRVMRLMHSAISFAMRRKFLKGPAPVFHSYRMMMASSADNTLSGMKQSSGMRFPLFEILLALANLGL